MGNRQQSGRAQTGFSLVEVMLVLVLIGLLSSAVILTFPGPKPVAEKETARLLANLNALSEQALVSNRVTAVGFSKTGYASYLFDEGAWQLQTRQNWPEGISSALEVEGVTMALPVKLSPLVLFEPTGQSTRFQLELASDQRRFVLASTGDGRVELQGQGHE
jgi:general secretion pathway protein H